MITIRRWYAYASPYAMFRDIHVETLAEAHAIANEIALECSNIGCRYRVEIISASARVVYASIDED